MRARKEHMIKKDKKNEVHEGLDESQTFFLSFEPFSFWKTELCLLIKPSFVL